MKISFYEKVQLAAHIERKISKLNIIDKDVEILVYEDIGDQLIREFGLNKKNPKLNKRYLYDAHEFIDSYEVPTYLKEMIRCSNVQTNYKPADE